MLSSENSALPGSSAGDSVAPVRLPQSLTAMSYAVLLALHWPVPALCGSLRVIFDL